MLKFLNLILCKQYTSCEKSIFIKGKESSDGSASPEIMALLVKRCGTFSEGEKGDNIEMNISRMKQISGEDKIVGRPLFYKDGLVEFYPYIKLHFGTNYIPALDDQQATKRELK
jgi:phage/plasmid-associated DNA primase